MSKKFEFKSNAVDLDICGEKFLIELTADIIGEINDIRTEAAKQLEILSDGNVDATKKIVEACAYLEKEINALLGEDAARRIFKNRRVNLFDLTDVLNFVMSQISAAIAAKTAYYSGKASK